MSLDTLQLSNKLTWVLVVPKLVVCNTGWTKIGDSGIPYNSRASNSDRRQLCVTGTHEHDPVFTVNVSPFCILPKWPQSAWIQKISQTNFGAPQPQTQKQPDDGASWRLMIQTRKWASSELMFKVSNEIIKMPQLRASHVWHKHSAELTDDQVIYMEHKTSKYVARYHLSHNALRLRIIERQSLLLYWDGRFFLFVNCLLF